MPRSEVQAMIKVKVPPHIEALEPYPPGKPIEELKRELNLSRVVKLASNENPFGPSPRAKEAVKAAAERLHRYPDGAGYYLKQKLSQKFSQPAERFVLGCGSNEILDLTCRVFVGPGQRAVLPHPSFLVYQKFLQAVGAEAVLVPLKELRIDLAAMARAADDQVRLVVLCNPNNPTGTALSLNEIKQFLDDAPPQTVVLVDEAYIDFVRDKKVGSVMAMVAEDRNLIVARTFSKAYGLAGLRVGYGVMPARLADFLNRVRQPFNVTAPALAAAEAALDDEAYVLDVTKRIWEGLDFLIKGLTRLGVEVVSSQTNFILFKPSCEAKAVYEKMLTQGVIIRHMDAFGLDDYLRVNVGTSEENQFFLERLSSVLTELSR